MTIYFSEQLAAKNQMGSKAGHSEALRLSSDLQECFAGRPDEIPNLVILATIILIHSLNLGHFSIIADSPTWRAMMLPYKGLLYFGMIFNNLFDEAPLGEELMFSDYSIGQLSSTSRKK